MDKQGVGEDMLTSLQNAQLDHIPTPPAHAYPQGFRLRPDALRLPEQPIAEGESKHPPHQANRRQKPAQAAPGIAASQVNSDRGRKPIIRPSCLGEFEWPQVGEFEVAIRARC